MAYVPKDMTGSLFKNDRKESERHPDYRGDILIGGVAYWLSAWVKEGKNGKFFSLAVKAKEDGKGAGKSEPPQRKRIEDDLDDSIPF